MPRYRDKIYGWRDIPEHFAERIARHLYHGITTKSGAAKMRYINRQFDGRQFSEDQLKEKIENDKS